jgi:hypothetical protein
LLLGHGRRDGICRTGPLTAARTGSIAPVDWQAWHTPYDEPGSPLDRRLRIVQRRIAEWLDENPERPVRVVSACAGQGRDLIEVLRARADGDRVRAVLVELDPRNAAAAGAAAPDGIEVRCADAGDVANYDGALPADLLLFCGVFGNVPDADVERTVRALAHLAAPGATVIWTRSRRAPDLTPAIRRWFAQSGFAERHFDAPADALFSVGVDRLQADPPPAMPSAGTLFRFTT